MDNVKLFLKETFASGVSIDNVFNSLGGELNGIVLFLQSFEVTFASGVSIDNVFNSLGGELNGIVFFLQSFEVWLNKRASKNVELADTSTNSAMPKCPECGGSNVHVEGYHCSDCNIPWLATSA